jgi:hypothetical protein
MESAPDRREAKSALETAHFVDDAGTDAGPAWEEIDTGRFMPRRIRGSYRGRALG